MAKGHFDDRLRVVDVDSICLLSLILHKIFGPPSCPVYSVGFGLIAPR